MARRPLALIAGGLVAALTLVPVAAVLWRAGGPATFAAGDGQALRFTLWQAAVSAAVSVALAVPVARALARRAFPGRAVLVTLLGAPFILPVIVAVLGLIAVFGNAGILNRGLEALGLPGVTVYGAHGVILAHVFFNLPLATRMILQGWLAIPGERLRLAAALGLGPWQVVRVVEWPMLRRVAPQAAAVIFVICLSSFAVALTLGGGPRATTVELAIYQAMRFEFDLGRAAMLACLQLALAMAAGLAALALSGAAGMGAGLDRTVPRHDAQRAGARFVDTIAIGAAAVFLLTPLALVGGNGAAGLFDLDAPVWRAAGRSVTVALASTALCLLWALPLATRRGEVAGLPGIAVSPLVLGTGLFILARPYVNPVALALPVTAIVNALMALPFALRILRPEAEAVRADYGRLAAALGLSGRVWLIRVFLPRLRRPLGFAAGLTAALSMGDLGVIALFADPERATLPLQVYRLMASYRMEAAQGAALVLLALSLGLFWVFDRGGRVNADA
ncbi:Sulfate transport system permease protein CysW [Roseivivax jejudonensis]|uniref:Sulfate transport system permease protein CysW n=1 Tax=Roseivivax jejudonensis TaxID=1529041 RepID=A0A1X6YB08_9RHOB|nr:ABC transporter permease subunit [Roseivivax jejudonensis]SLN15608.1 Sulfate transport system permease protein CysW [Roseivivax jejudonensis]